MELRFVSEIREHKVRGVKTLFTCLCYICIGLQGAVIGVSFLDLKVLAGCEFSQITLILTGGSIGYASGSVVAGFLESRFNVQLVIATSLAITAICQFGYPLTRSLILMVFFGVNAGFFSGMVDCFSNIFILKLWAKECPPFLQALHFCYGVGSFIAPLVAAPYLKEVGEESKESRDISRSNISVTRVYPSPEDIELIIPFSMISGFTAAVAVCFLFMYFRYRETSDHPSRRPKGEKSGGEGADDGGADDGGADDEGADDGGADDEVKRTLNPRVKLVVMLLAATFLMLYGGIEQTVGHLVAPYAHDGPLKVTKQVSAQMASVFWVTFTCFRLVAVLLSGIMGSLAMLVFNTIVTIAASFLLAVIQSDELVFWFTCALMGIGLSSTFGSLFAYLESQFPVHGKIVATLTVGAAIGSSCTPAMIGYLMGIEVRIFAWFPIVFTLLFTVIFIVLYLTCKTMLYTEEWKVSKSQVSTPPEKQLAETSRSRSPEGEHPSFVKSR